MSAAAILKSVEMATLRGSGSGGVAGPTRERRYGPPLPSISRVDGFEWSMPERQPRVPPAKPANRVATCLGRVCTTCPCAVLLAGVFLVTIAFLGSRYPRGAGGSHVAARGPHVTFEPAARGARNAVSGSSAERHGASPLAAARNWRGVTAAGRGAAARTPMLEKGSGSGIGSRTDTDSGDFPTERASTLAASKYRTRSPERSAAGQEQVRRKQRLQARRSSSSWPHKGPTKLSAAGEVQGAATGKPRRSGQSRGGVQVSPEDPTLARGSAQAGQTASSAGRTRGAAISQRYRVEAAAADLMDAGKEEPVGGGAFGSTTVEDELVDPSLPADSLREARRGAGATSGRQGLRGGDSQSGSRDLNAGALAKAAARMHNEVREEGELAAQAREAARAADALPEMLPDYVDGRSDESESAAVAVTAEEEQQPRGTLDVLENNLDGLRPEDDVTGVVSERPEHVVVPDDSGPEERNSEDVRSGQSKTDLSQKLDAIWERLLNKPEDADTQLPGRAAQSKSKELSVQEVWDKHFADSSTRNKPSKRTSVSQIRGDRQGISGGSGVSAALHSQRGTSQSGSRSTADGRNGRAGVPDLPGQYKEMDALSGGRAQQASSQRQTGTEQAMKAESKAYGQEGPDFGMDVRPRSKAARSSNARLPARDVADAEQLRGADMGDAEVEGGIGGGLWDDGHTSTRRTGVAAGSEGEEAATDRVGARGTDDGAWEREDERTIETGTAVGRERQAASSTGQQGTGQYAGEEDLAGEAVREPGESGRLGEEDDMAYRPERGV